MIRRLLMAAALLAASAPLAAADAVPLPHVGIDDSLPEPATFAPAAQAAGNSTSDVPLLLRLAVRAADVTADGAIRTAPFDTRLATLGPGVRLWLRLPSPPGAVDSAAVSSWRGLVRSLVEHGGSRLSIAEVDLTHAEDPARASFWLRVAAVQVRAVNPDALVAIAAGGGDASAERLDRLYRAGDVSPYIDLIALDGPQAMARVHAVRALLDRVDPDARIARTGVPLGVDPDAAAHRFLESELDTLGTAVAVNTYATTAEGVRALLGAARRIADLLSGDILTLDPAASALEVTRDGTALSDLPVRLLYDVSTFSTYLVLQPGRAGAPIDISLHLAESGSVMVRRPASGETRPALTASRDEARQVVHARVPAEAGPAIVDFNYGAAGRYALRDEARAARALTVAEIIARHQQVQAAEDDLLDTYVVDARMAQHFRPSAADAGYDVVSDTRLYRDREGIEWDERSFSVNGTKWGPDRPPFPLLQAEKVLSLPLELRLTADYAYRLLGVDTVDGRRCYAVAFEPHDRSRSLYRGTVWIDAERFTRAKIQTVQTRLSSPVVSSEEVQRFEQVPGPGGRTFSLPARIDTKQLLLVAGRNLLVEKAVTFGAYRINPAAFAELRGEARASDRIMYRETEEGLRYFVKEHGTRVVSDRMTSSAKAMAMGVTIDPSFDFPLPMFGINYLDFDFHGKDNQLAMLFAGVLVLANVQHSRLLGTPLDASVDLFAIAVPGNDRVYDETGEHRAERLLTWPLTFGGNVGWQFTDFQKLTGTYQFRFDGYAADRTTASDYLTPRSTITNGAGLGYEWRRAGYSVVANGTWYRRVGWRAWGVPGQLEIARPAYAKYSLSVSKDVFLSAFSKLHLNGAWFGGDHLDRFTRYQFGLFDDTKMHGVPASGIRFGQLGMVRGAYSFNVFEQYRFDLFLEHAVGRRTSGDALRHITGIGAAFNLRTPWGTMLRTDVGKSLLPDAFKGTGSFVLQVLVLKPL